MTISILLTMFTFSLVMSISPGPVNIMILSSSINNGFLKTFSFISGATIGFTLLLIFIVFGFSTILLDYPNFLAYLGIIGSIFIIYMGYKIATSTNTIEISKEDKKLKFHEGFLLQWLNPKAWLACFSGSSMFSISTTSLIILVVIYFFVCYISLSLWGILGQKATFILSTNFRLKIFNIFMGSLLIISAFYLIVINYIDLIGT